MELLTVWKVVQPFASLLLDQNVLIHTDNKVLAQAYISGSQTGGHRPQVGLKWVLDPIMFLVANVVCICILLT